MYIPQNTTQFSIFHIFLCHKYISWPIIVLLYSFRCIFCGALQLDLDLQLDCMQIGVLDI